MRGFRPLRIHDLRRETEDAVSLSFGQPDGFAFTPGQYLTLRTWIGGEDVRRSYSICSGPTDGELRVAIKLVPGGRFSAWAHATLRPGHVIDVMPPDGRFTHRPDPAARATYLGVAAGSGITPVMSILKSVLTLEPRSRFLLLYGSRSTDQILFRETLEELKDRYLDRFGVVHVLSREQQDVPILHGRLDGPRVLKLLTGLAEPPSLDAAFLCGPGDMIGAVTEALTGAGLPPGRVHSERFSPSGEPVLRPRPVVTQGPPFATATIIADGIRTEVPLAEGETVLEAALRSGLDLPYSCRGGMCSSCRARVTEGTVKMDVNYALEPWELASGYALTCQSHPTTHHVTVDYDHV
ncbi:MAG TPA: 2Fe-2S iron-sulfur cluster-binding protein [Acetobacteraceae bacterium]|nr:2Fe-2S iron-sulfur cluster-binding protein [Acetobacteraceae bacterium]